MSRPKVPEDLRRAEKLLLSFTVAEMRSLRILSAQEGSDPRDWARQLILDTIEIRSGQPHPKP